MNLSSISSSVTSIVNPKTEVYVLYSDGYTIDPATQKQVPSYSAPVVMFADVQDLSSSDLRHIDGLNLQSQTKVIYLNGNISGINRPDGLGCDLVDINNQKWMVVLVPESYPGWCKAIIMRQVNV